MIHYGNRAISLVVLVSVVLHFTWGFLLLHSPDAYHTTALSGLYEIVPHPKWIPALLFWAAFTAVCGSLAKDPWYVLLLLPQQFLLTVSALSAINAMLVGHFADGTVRPHIFIIIDQFHVVLLMIGHALAMILKHDS